MTTNETLKALEKEPLVTRIRMFAAQLEDLSANLEDNYNWDAMRYVKWVLSDLYGIIESCDAIEPIHALATKDVA